MQIIDILRHKGHDVVTIGADGTVHDAIRRMNEHKCGALVVTVEGGKLSGIITERDILRECGERCTRLTESSARRESACPALVRDVMTKDVIICLPDDELHYVMGIMTKNKVRHLPVLGAGKLVGIISIGDVVNAHVEEADFENRMLKDYIHGVSH